MIDLNKLRSEFESIKEIQDSIRREQLIFNPKLGCYTKKSGKMCVSANWTNGAWFVFERKAKAQAVPDTHILIPKEPNHKTIMAMACVCLGAVGSDPEFLTLKDAKDVYSALVEKESGAEG
ncbi:hypothetical protein ABBY97_14235 [Acinetobacter baumannii]|uniref:hypothetical protein n=1 Tax=Acinetobacter baumannii TaxID=470 RepID=UPI0035A4A5AB